MHTTAQQLATVESAVVYLHMYIIYIYNRFTYHSGGNELCCRVRPRCSRRFLANMRRGFNNNNNNTITNLRVCVRN